MSNRHKNGAGASPHQYRRFVLDEAKAQSNLRKHGISFKNAILVFDDPLATVYPDRIMDGEERKHIVGTTGDCLLLLVVDASKEIADTEIIRIISVSRATRHGRRTHGNGYSQHLSRTEQITSSKLAK